MQMTPSFILALIHPVLSHHPFSSTQLNSWLHTYVFLLEAHKTWVCMNISVSTKSVFNSLKTTSLTVADTPIHLPMHISSAAHSQSSVWPFVIWNICLLTKSAFFQLCNLPLQLQTVQNNSACVFHRKIKTLIFFIRTSLLVPCLVWHS